LLSRKPADKSTAAYFTPCLEFSINHEQLAPGRSQSLAVQQLAHHDSIPAQQRVGYFFNVRVCCSASGISVAARSGGKPSQCPSRKRPAPGALHAKDRGPVPPPDAWRNRPPVRRRQKRPQPGEAIRRHQSPGNQLAKRILYL